MVDQILTLAADPAAWAALVTLIVMEIVLGIDNLIFISILTNKLPESSRATARRIGLSLALLMRLALLGTLAIIVHLTEPVFEVAGKGFSWRDLILIAGGLFLIWKATKEIHESVDPDEESDAGKVVRVTFASAIAQVLILDLVFSIDSIITAVGMTDHLPIMVVAVLVAVGVMMLAAGPLAAFIHANPTIVMLALGFLLMIGMTLIADGFGVHVPKGYIYTAMAFSTLVEALNMLSRRAKRRRARGAQNVSASHAEAELAGGIEQVH
jgi:predicted tellurium resistance membrane protein TerC